MGRAVPGRGRHLRAVADAFLPLAGPGPAVPGPIPAAGGPGSTRETAPQLFAAAPGDADTASVLAMLCPVVSPAGTRDLGGAVGVRLGRLERTADLTRSGADPPLLFWCPRAEEGLSLAAGMALGRLGALIRPGRVTVLWFAGAGAGRRSPGEGRIEAALNLARAASPGAAVSLHCLGWTGDPLRQLEDLAGRFR